MADTKLTGLTANTTPALTDLVYLVDDPGGTALSQKITVAALLATPSATLVTPVLGVATGTSLALGGATLGSNALAVTGTGTFSSTITSTTDGLVGGYLVTGTAASQRVTLNSSGSQGQIYIGSTGILGFTNTSNSSSTVDTSLFRDAAGVLAQRNAADAQTFRVYGTWTDASNYERASLSHVTGTGVLLAAQTAGTGGDNLSITLTAAGSGNIILNGDAVTVSNNLTASGNIHAVGLVRCGAEGALYWATRSLMYSPADGVIQLTNQAATDFSRLQFGGTTNSFPALKRSTTEIQVRLADDSAYAPIDASAYKVAGAAGVSFGPAAPASITVVNGIVTAIS